MVKIEQLFAEGKISKINENELNRYIHFFENSYKENLEHAIFVLSKFPRHSIISGYYAMHDITKLFLAKKFSIKIDFEVHLTTIILLNELTKNPEMSSLLEKGYGLFISLANDLSIARKERTKAQYYTGSSFNKKYFEKNAKEFIEEIVLPYLEKLKNLMETQK